MAPAVGVWGILLALLGGLAATRRVEGQGISPVQVVLPPCQTARHTVEADISTGLNISPGQQDPHWQLVTIPPNQTGAFPAYATIPYSSWITATLPAQWIHRIQNFTPQSDSAGSYIYRLQFNLNPALYSSIQIVGNYAADNSVFVQLNGVPKTFCPGNVCFQGFHAFSLTSGFVSGVNDLDIIVNNDSVSPTGLLVEAKLQATCLAGCVPAPSGMVAWWPLDETTGATVVHDTAGGNNGTPNAGPVGLGGPTPGSGMVAGALNFNGTSDFVQIPNASTLNFGTGSLSIDAWVKIPSPGLGLMPIVDKEVAGPTDAPYGYAFYVKDGHLGFSMSNDINATPHASIGADDATHNLADNNWHHVAVAVQRSPASATGGNLFLDGATITTATFSTTPFANLTADNTGGLILGSRNRLGRLPVSDFFNGWMDEVEIFSRALAQTEIQGIYGAGSSGKCRPACAQPPAGLAAWWPLDETTGTAIHDIWTYHLGGTASPAAVGAGGPSSVAGQHVNNSLYFIGSYVDVPDSPHLKFFPPLGTGEFSIDAWVWILGTNNHSTVAFVHPVVDKTLVAGSFVTGYALYLYWPAGQAPQLAFTLDDGTVAVTPTPPPALLYSTPLSAGWHHVAVTVARPNLLSAAVTLYVDGAPQSATTLVGNTDNGEHLWIGKSRVGSLVGAGDGIEFGIDEVEIFNGVLTPQDILAIDQADSLGKCRARPLARPPARELPFR